MGWLGEEMVSPPNPGALSAFDHSPRRSHGGAVSEGSPVRHGNSREISRTANYDVYRD